MSTIEDMSNEPTPVDKHTALPLGYEVPEIYDGRLPDGRLALIIVMSNDSLHLVKVGPMPFGEKVSNVEMMASPRRIHYLGGHRRTDYITAIIPDGSPDTIRPASPR
jgi:hypothetical protein